MDGRDGEMMNNQAHDASQQASSGSGSSAAFTDLLLELVAVDGCAGALQDPPRSDIVGASRSPELSEARPSRPLGNSTMFAVMIVC